MANESRNVSEKSDVNAADRVNTINFFWCAELNTRTRTVTWAMKSEDHEEDDSIKHSLCVTQAVLGSGSVSKEQNIITLESMNADGHMKKGVIANLTKGSSAMAQLQFIISGKVGAIFTLSEGSGPVFISGNHCIEYSEDIDLGDLSQTESDDSDLDEDEEEEEEEGEEEDEDEEEREENNTVKHRNLVKPHKPKSATIDMTEDGVCDEERPECYDVEEDEYDKNSDYGEDECTRQKKKKSNLLSKSLGGIVKGIHNLRTDGKKCEFGEKKPQKQKKKKKGNFFSKSLGTIIKGIQDFSPDINLGAIAQWQQESSENSD